MAIDIEVWGKRGEAFAQHVTTKSPIFVEGKLMFDQWKAEDGASRSKMYLRVDDWQFLGAAARGSESERDHDQGGSSPQRSANWDDGRRQTAGAR